MRHTGALATAICVAYRTTTLDLSWVPDDACVIVVHNDRSLDPANVRHPGVRHVFSDTNVGFGAAVNLALPHVSTARVVLANPDTRLRPEHWVALAGGPETEVGAVPLSRPDGSPTTVVAPYPTPLTALLMAYRAGRWLPSGRTRMFVTRVLVGRGGRGRRIGRRAPEGGGEVRPLTGWWVSGAVASWPTGPLRAVGGFDESYFLYYEDLDLCRRLAREFPNMSARLHPVVAGVHEVGASAGGRSARSVAEQHRLRSAHRYMQSQPGVAWRVVTALTGWRLAPR